MGKKFRKGQRVMMHGKWYRVLGSLRAGQMQWGREVVLDSYLMALDRKGAATFFTSRSAVHQFAGTTS